MNVLVKKSECPVIKEKDYIGINGVGINQLIHPHFEIWQKFFRNHFEFKSNTKTILFLPCAAIKPYYNSPIHKEFNKVIEKYKNLQRIVISNAGIIVYEYIRKYPFNSYDWNPLLETVEIKNLYIKIISERIYKFFNLKELKSDLRYITYLRNDSESIAALKIAFEKLGKELQIIRVTGSLHETADTDLLLILDENLAKLEKVLKK